MQNINCFQEAGGRRLPGYGELLRDQAARMPRRVFARVDDDQLSYGALYERALAVAKGLFAAGVGRGDRVGILMPNCPEFYVAYFATQLLGAIVVPINARFKTHELAHVLTHSDVKVLFTCDRIDEHVNFVDLIWQTLPELSEAPADADLKLELAPQLKKIVVFGAPPRQPAISADRFIELGHAVAADLPVPVSVDDVAVMLYTSGTTAAPKGCQLTSRGLYHSWLTGYADAVALAEGEKIWAPLPLFHVGGIGPLTAALARGATVISSIHYEPRAALRQIADHRPEHLYPGFFTLLLPVLREPGYDKGLLASARSAINVAPFETQQLIKKLLPESVKVLQIFAMTEASGYVTLTPPDASEEHRLKTNGVPLPGIEVRITHPDTGEVVAAGEEGEIQFRGPVAFHSYYRDEPATAATILPGGWVRTGDHGRMDADGTVYFIGRIKDMLKVGGENVGAAEIESFLSTHPAVKLAQVVAKPDEHYGEVPVAFIELLPGQSAAPEELIDFCASRMARFKVPREVFFVTEWPMSATKIQKFKLRERLATASPA